MATVVVRRDPDKGYYFTLHNSQGAVVAISQCWASKPECNEYIRPRLPTRVPVEDKTLGAFG
jgi:hypothetical protein